ncbi:MULTISPECIES: MFS transporter [unclassified Lacticaseibacillus]|uniref:MDR family MFS transporter n=1 Tax=unclassified Lacticaseibacillus TaxID=2759744 RepID=UPI0019445DEE|nr:MULTISPECIES: MFS transporter [unclassified Lacticaseibacillus]
MAKKTLTLKWLFLGSLITNTGISFIWPLTTIYMHEYLGESLTVSGIVLFFNSVAMMLGNLIGGRLFDRWSPYRTILTGIALDVGTSLALIFWHGWPAYPLLLVVMGFGSGLVNTAINSFATLSTSRRASYVFNVLYFMQNLGLVIGTLIVGYVLPLGIAWIFALAFVMFLMFFGVALVHFNVTPRPSTERVKAAKAARRNPHLINIMLLLATLFLTWVAYEQWQSNISTFMLSLGMNVRNYSFLWTFNAVLIVLGQPILTLFDDWLTAHLRLRLGVGFALFGTAFLLLIPARSYWMFVLAMGVLTLGEILALPSVATYVDMYTDLTEKGRFQGYVQMFASAGRAVGPLAGALVIEAVGYHPLFLALAIILYVSIAIFSWRAAAVR